MHVYDIGVHFVPVQATSCYLSGEDGVRDSAVKARNAAISQATPLHSPLVADPRKLAFTQVFEFHFQLLYNFL